MAMAMLLTQRRFTVDEYYRMTDTGILSPDDRVELIDGVIAEMSPPGSRHAASVARGTRLFSAQLADVAHLRVQLPVRLGQRDEPEPDLALVQPKPGDYADAHPGPEDVLLVIEVSDSTLEGDRGVKMQRYALFGLPEAWVIDLVHNVLLVHTDPGPEGYRNVRMLRPGEQVAPAAFPDRPVAVDALLP
jgi:hypothetical protein